MATTATLKRSIKPVTFTVTVEARKVNENGTFSSFVFKGVKGPNSTAKAVSPPQAGGAIYLKVESLEGIEFDDDAASGIMAKIKAKLF
jgi:hypothetical protein